VKVKSNDINPGSLSFMSANVDEQNGHLYIFGGKNKQNISSDIWKLGNDYYSLEFINNYEFRY
jgi:hypothetical protein